MDKSNSIVLITNEVIQKPEPKRPFTQTWWKEYLKLPKKQQKPEKEMIIDITISLPKATPKPKRKVRVFNNFVKVGWDQYRINIDPYTGYEYVKIKGTRYEVVRDYFNQGVLVEI